MIFSLHLSIREKGERSFWLLRYWCSPVYIYSAKEGNFDYYRLIITESRSTIDPISCLRELNVRIRANIVVDNFRFKWVNGPKKKAKEKEKDLKIRGLAKRNRVVTVDETNSLITRSRNTPLPRSRNVTSSRYVTSRRRHTDRETDE